MSSGKNTKSVEVLKTALVCVLLVTLICLCAIYLFNFEETVDAQFGKAELGELKTESAKQSYASLLDKTLALPYFISYSDATGKRTSALASGEAFDTLYTDASRLCDGIFGDNGACEKTDRVTGEKIMEEAFSGAFFYMCFPYELPRQAVCAAMMPGGIYETSGNEYISEIVIYPTNEYTVVKKELGTDLYESIYLYSYAAVSKDEHNNYSLYYLKAMPKTQDDIYFNTIFPASYNMTGTVSAEFALNGSLDGFISENNIKKSISPTAIITDGLTGKQITVNEKSLSGYEEKLAGAFSLNVGKASVYTGDDGSVTYYEEGHNVVISGGRQAIYSSTGISGGIPLSELLGQSSGSDICDYIGMSLILIKKMQMDAGCLDICLTGVYYNNGTVDISFGYTYESLPVEACGKSSFLNFRFRERTLVYADCSFISAYETDSREITVPQSWALFMFLLSEDNGTKLCPAYACDEYGKSVYPSWYVYSVTASDKSSAEVAK